MVIWKRARERAEVASLRSTRERPLGATSPALGLPGRGDVVAIPEGWRCVECESRRRGGEAPKAEKTLPTATEGSPPLSPRPAKGELIQVTAEQRARVEALQARGNVTVDLTRMRFAFVCAQHQRFLRGVSSAACARALHSLHPTPAASPG